MCNLTARFIVRHLLQENLPMLRQASAVFIRQAIKINDSMALVQFEEKHKLLRPLLPVRVTAIYNMATFAKKQLAYSVKIGKLEYNFISV